MRETKAIVQQAYGDASVLKLCSIPVRAPEDGEVTVRHTAIGVNYHDLYVRTGLYKTLQLPGVPGIEAVGEIVGWGPNVDTWHLGQRVAYVSKYYGAYCEERTLHQSLLLKLPEDIPDILAASCLVRGLTAAMLIEYVLKVRPRQLCVVHAAGGATGRLLVAWAASIGARVVGIVGDRSKLRDLEHLCESVFSYNDPTWPKPLIAQYGAGADCVLDSVGAPTLETSIAVAAPCSHIALFGQSGGAVEHVSISSLASKSLTITRPILFDYLVDPVRRQAMMDSFIERFRAGILRLQSPMTMPLGDAAKAQTMLEMRSSHGPIVLVP